jgi:hypothetical protein
MSAIFATQLTAIATTVLAVFTIATATVAGLAFKKQADAARDSRRLIQQQAGMLQIQQEQLEVHRQQFEDQHEANVTQGGVLDLQAEEIRASLEQRMRDAEAQRRSQAARVTAWLARSAPGEPWEARIRNDSDLPIFDVRTFFHKIHKVESVSGGGDWEPVGQGGVPPEEHVCVFPPKTDRSLKVPGAVREMFSGEITDRTCVVSIEFTDAAGGHWERDARGALTPHT